jgi:hypothetical protein
MRETPNQGTSNESCMIIFLFFKEGLHRIENHFPKQMEDLVQKNTQNE